MRVVQVADYGGSYGGSFVPMLIAISRAVVRRGWEPVVALPADLTERAWLPALRESGTSVCFFRRGSVPAVRRELRELIEDSRRAVLHTHFTGFDVPATLAARAEDAVVWHIHSAVREGLAVGARSRLKHALLGRRVDSILAVAPDVADTARARGAPANRVHFIPNAVDTTLLPAFEQDERRVARELLELPAEAEVLLHFGWEWERKGGDLFLAAAGQLVAAGRNVVALSVGATSAPAQNVLGERFRTAPPTNETRSLFAAASVFVSPSRAEGMPYAMAEALCLGLPVAATAIPGQVALGEGLAACELVPADPGALAQGIARLLDKTAAERDTAAADARARIVARHDLVPWAERIAVEYARVLGLPEDE